MVESWSTDVDPLITPWLAPRLTTDHPGSGGVLRSAPEDFRVREELPYPLTGEGTHLFVRIEKSGIDSLTVIRRLAQVAGVRPDDVGAAGLKDRWAIAEQWLSVPDASDLEPRLAELEDDDLTIQAVTRHPHKLRRGHVAANHFRIRLREVPPDGLGRASATLDALKQSGLPNTFGRQRFGRDGDNPQRGVELLRRPRRRGHRLGALLVSSVQSAVFNRVLALRIHRGELRRALMGDLMQKHDTGGLFDVTDPTAEQPRVDRVDISATGPIVGKRMRSPSDAPAQAEADALAACRLTEDDLPRFGRGSRRALRIPCDPEARVHAPEPGVLEVSFKLPSGSYATTLLDELIKPPGGMFAREPTIEVGSPRS